MANQRLSPVRKAQKYALDASAAATNAATALSKKTGEHLQRLDEERGISSRFREAGTQLRRASHQLDEKLGVSEASSAVAKHLSTAAEKTTSKADEIAEASGLYGVANKASALVYEHLAEPAANLLARFGVEERLEAIGRACEDLYGSSRAVIKPYFPPETPHELLRGTRKELAYISACIMQISPGQAENLANQFGKTVASKIAGISASGALLSLVSTFGTAGTGTAIASLSGAASTSASLAWVGGLLGGGMATGAVLTGGVGIVAGLAAYKTLGSVGRNFEDLDETEQRIVQYCWMLIAMIDDYLEGSDGDFSADSANTFLNDTLIPLQTLLQENSESICENLDRKNAIAFRQHVLRDFGPAIIDPFSSFVASSRAKKSLHYDYVIGGVLYALLTRSAVDDSLESRLVLAALRRSDNALAAASEAELSRYLNSYDAEQLKGIANNVKGIYHELLWVEQFNASHEDRRAEIFSATNHAGSDVRIVDVDSGDVVAEYQLKATDNVAYLNEHLIRYPSIQVVVTDEAAAQLEGAQASGNLNVRLTEDVKTDLEALGDNTLDDRVLESAGLAAAISTGRELLEMLRGDREFPESVTEVVKRTGTAGAATALAAYLFS
jgi:hypothetical protein